MRHLLAVAVTVTLLTPALRAADKATTPSAEEQAMMKKMMEYGTPGEEHKRLEPMVGNFNAVVKMWMKPGDKPTESKGMATHTWIMGGRYLKQEFKGEWAGQPFEGLGYVAFDKVRQEYQSIWLDGMMTSIMYSAGTYDAASNTVRQSGTMSCPMTGDKNKWVRSEMKFKDANNHSYLSYGKGPDGKEFKAMEVTYTRIP